MYDDLIELLCKKEEVHGLYFCSFEELSRIKQKLDITSAVTNRIEKNLEEYLKKNEQLNLIIAFVREHTLICSQNIDMGNGVVGSALANNLKTLSLFLSQLKGMLDEEDFEKELRQLQQLAQDTTFITPLEVGSSTTTDDDPYV